MCTIQLVLLWLAIQLQHNKLIPSSVLDTVALLSKRHYIIQSCCKIEDNCAMLCTCIYAASGISYGRIATLFLLGYELCSAFIRRHGAPLFMKFISRLLNYLIKFLKDIGFFDWLVRHSWVCIYIYIYVSTKFFQYVYRIILC